jgi:hypothetical protein
VINLALLLLGIFLIAFQNWLFGSMFIIAAITGWVA